MSKWNDGNDGASMLFTFFQEVGVVCFGELVLRAGYYQLEYINVLCHLSPAPSTYTKNPGCILQDCPVM